MERSLKKIDPSTLAEDTKLLPETPPVIKETDADLKEQLLFIQKVSEDIDKLSSKIAV